MLVIEVNDQRSGPVETTVEIETWHPTAKLAAQPDAIAADRQAADRRTKMSSGRMPTPLPWRWARTRAFRSGPKRGNSSKLHLSGEVLHDPGRV